MTHREPHARLQAMYLLRGADMLDTEPLCRTAMCKKSFAIIARNREEVCLCLSTSENRTDRLHNDEVSAVPRSFFLPRPRKTEETPSAERLCLVPAGEGDLHRRVGKSGVHRGQVH